MNTLSAALSVKTSAPLPPAMPSMFRKVAVPKPVLCGAVVLRLTVMPVLPASL
jgi:hypothetical protein